MNQPESIWKTDTPDLLGVAPPLSELPVEEVESLTARDLCKVRGQLVDQHRHEDQLLNSRLEAYLLAATIVAAGFTQVFPAQAPLACVFSAVGLLLSVVMFHVLRRTARAIQWNIAVICAIEAKLYPDARLKGTYSRRRELREARVPVSAILGAGLPFCGTWIFGVLLALAISELKCW